MDNVNMMNGKPLITHDPLTATPSRTSHVSDAKAYRDEMERCAASCGVPMSRINELPEISVSLERRNGKGRRAHLFPWRGGMHKLSEIAEMEGLTKFCVWYRLCKTPNHADIDTAVAEAKLARERRIERGRRK